MATTTVTKKKNEAKTASGKPVKGEPRLKKDGTPWTPAQKRPNEVILAEYKTRREEFIERSRKTLAHYDSKIAYFENLTTSGDTVLKDVLADFDIEGMAAMEAKLRKAKAALKGKTVEEIEALRAEALANRAPVSGLDDESDEE